MTTQEMIDKVSASLDREPLSVRILPGGPNFMGYYQVRIDEQWTILFDPTTGHIVPFLPDKTKTLNFYNS